MRLSSIVFICLLWLSQTDAVYTQTKHIISGKGVYFFGPSIAEADSVPLNESEALNGFATYSNQMALFAKSNEISYGYVSARIIEVQFGSMRVFTLCRDTVEFGTIFTDGKKVPLLIPYVAVDSELKKRAKEYFELK